MVSLQWKITSATEFLLPRPHVDSLISIQIKILKPWVTMVTADWYRTSHVCKSVFHHFWSQKSKPMLIICTNDPWRCIKLCCSSTAQRLCAVLQTKLWAKLYTMQDKCYMKVTFPSDGTFVSVLFQIIHLQWGNKKRSMLLYLWSLVVSRSYSCRQK